MTLKRSGPGISYRAARTADLPRIRELLQAAGLPDRNLEEFLDGFSVAERGEQIIAVGGYELHLDTAVLRSFAVDESVRGQGVGAALTRRLLEEARRAGVADLYLFTGSSWPFWQKQGFRELPMEEWREPARECWQYEYLSSHPGYRQRYDLHSMWQPGG